MPKKEFSGFSSFDCFKSNVACKEFEGVWCKIFSNTFKVKIGLIYRRPTYFACMPDKLINYLNSCMESDEPTIIAGDFNYPAIDWSSLIASNNLGQNKFLQFMISNGFEQIVDFPTRNNAILDLIFINSPNLLQCAKLGNKVLGCDHETVTTVFPVQQVEYIQQKFRNFSNVNYLALEQTIDSIDWDNLLSGCSNIDHIWSSFLVNIAALVEVFVPLQTRPSLNSSTSPKISRLCRKAYRLHKQYHSTKNPLVHRKYLEVSKNAQQEKRNQIIKRENKVLRSGNISSFWKFIRGKLNYRADIPCLIDSSDNKVITSSKAKADLLNSHFVSIFTKDDGNLPNWGIQQSDQFLSYVDFLPENVFAELSTLPSKFSSGPDHLPAILLKKCALSLAYPLSLIFNYSFRNSVLPTQWLSAFVTPIFKNKGTQSDPINYRPISLTCYCCKVMEAIMVKQLSNFLSKKSS